MKQLLILSFIAITFIPEKSVSQNCEALNSLNSFHGIKFEFNIADSIKSSFKLEYGNEIKFYKDYYLDSRMFDRDQNLFKKFYQWFFFGDENFSRLIITCLPDDRVYEITLMKFYNSKDLSSDINDSIDLVNGKLPPMFTKADRELKFLFGNPTRTDQNSDLMGNHYSHYWDCEKQRVQLSLLYKNDTGPYSTGLTLMTEIIITNDKLDKIEKLNELKN